MNTETAPEPTITDLSKPQLDPAVRSYLAMIGSKGGRAVSKTALSLAAKRNAKSTWAKRRIRYGPTGRRQPWQIKAAKMQAATALPGRVSP